MRIIAGAAKGKKLRAPEGLATRPMTGRAREGLFSSLAGRPVGGRILDLYAGSGSLGLEALSRGAVAATFVEQNATAVAALRENIATIGLGGTVVRRDVMKYLQERTGGVDVVFVDPPYALPLPSVDDVLARLVGHLGAGAVVIIHRRRGGDPPHPPEGLVPVDRRSYGDSELFRFEKEDS